MNAYFHSFVPSWNNWYVMVPFLLLLGCFISCMAETQFLWVYDLAFGCKVIRYRKARQQGITILLLELLTIITSTAIATSMILAESWVGIVQYCCNYVISGSDTLTQAYKAAAVIVVACAIVFIVMMAWVLQNGWRLAVAGIFVIDLAIVLVARWVNTHPIHGPSQPEQTDQSTRSGQPGREAYSPRS